MYRRAGGEPVFEQALRSIRDELEELLERGAPPREFRDCVSFGARPLSEATVKTVIDMVHNLENLKDATEIMRALG